MSLKRLAIFIHRWLGVLLCLLFLLWFPSGIGMMYWDFPSVTAADCLARAPALDPSTIHLSPTEAFAALGSSPAPGDVRLNTFDGRPAYRFRVGGDERIVYADTGERQTAVPGDTALRIASAWVKQAPEVATGETIDDADQWTVEGTFRALRPLRKYSWPNGEQVYVSQATGEVVQYTTSRSRLGAYLGPIPHWLYFTPLRKRQTVWSSLVIWSSGLGAVTATLGLSLGVWMYSPSRRYRYRGTPARTPYRGQKRWHMLLGLIFGLGAITWAFSGLLSMDPFPATAAPAAGAGGIGTTADLARALRGRVQLAAFDNMDPRDLLARMADRRVKELELTSFSGEPAFLAHLDGGDTRVITPDGRIRAEFDRQRIIRLATQASAPAAVADVRELDRYDVYYLDRHHTRPLPVLLVRLNDAARTRYYIDPKTARVVGTYSSRHWVTRWLYHGLHSLDVPWLYDHRPAWDVIVITFMLGGTTLIVTSLLLAWRVLIRHLASFQ